MKFLRSSGFCVATPTGQVSRWQTRIIVQPSVTSGAVAKPNSSAPNRAAITTSRPVRSWPSVSSTHPAAQVVDQQRLVRLGNGQLPRQPGVLDARLRRGAGAAVIAADQDHVGVALGHPGRDGADPHLRHQLDADAGRGLAFLRS